MKRFLIPMVVGWAFTMAHWASSEVSLEAQGLFKQAIELNAQGDYPNALSNYVQAYNADPDILGLTDEGLLDNATRYFTEFLNANTGDINSLMWLASIHTIKGDLRSAMDNYQKVILYAPNSDSALQADKEILRMEAILKGKAAQEEEKVQQKMAQSQVEDRIRANVIREMEDKYRAQITNLQAEVDRLKRQLYDAQQAEEAARKKADEIAAGVEKLEDEAERSRKLHLYYRRKAMDSGN